jgi:hypothetical protein
MKFLVQYSYFVTRFIFRGKFPEVKKGELIADELMEELQQKVELFMKQNCKKTHLLMDNMARLNKSSIMDMYCRTIYCQLQNINEQTSKIAQEDGVL